MICKNCSASFEDSLPFCPECGEKVNLTSNEGTSEILNVNTSQGTFEDIFSDSSKQKVFQETEIAPVKAGFVETSAQEQAESEEQAQSEIQTEESTKIYPEETPEETTQTENSEPEKETTDESEVISQSEQVNTQTATESNRLSETKSAYVQKREIKPRPVRRPPTAQPTRIRENTGAAPKRMKQERPRKETAQEKKAHKIVLVTSSVMAVLLCVLSVVGLFTDVFKKDDSIKAVGISVLTAQEQELLENGVSKLYTVSQGKEYEQGTVSAEDILHSLAVGKDNGVFAYLNGKAEYVTEKSDPALRYKRETQLQTEYTTNSETQTGDYEYYTVKKEDMGRVLKELGIKEDLTVNCEHCYLYGDYYYFAPSEENYAFNQYNVKIKSSKRMQDGGYYAVCSLDKDEVYVTAYKNQSDDGEITWDIKSVKNEPVFDSLGNIIDYTEEGDVDFEMKRTVIEGFLDDGETLFCEYIIEYPFFNGTTPGETNLNTLFASAVANYTSQSESAQTLYKEYKKQGYDENALPLQVYFRAEVAYNGEDYIGIKSVISESAKIPVEKQEETTTSSYNYTYNQPQQESVALGSKIVEGYTVDLQTGDYVNKDVFIGKKYLDVQEIIYRIYNSYDYSTVLSGDEQYIYDEVPYDSAETGKDFYENGASALTENGYMFFKVNEVGVVEEVLIPNEALSKLTQ